MTRKALGRGLEALLPVGEDKKVIENQYIRMIGVEQIRPNPYQPRHDFSAEELQRLADSIRERGLLQPIIVRRKGDGVYELVAGERRWRAAKLAGLDSLPALVRNCGDSETIMYALIENLQRQDLNPMETARAYQRMGGEFRMTQDQIAAVVGKDRSSVANFARFVHLPQEVQRLVESGAISAGHAKILLGVGSRDLQTRLAQRIAREQLTVRQTERLAGEGQRARRAKPARAARHPYSDLETGLQRRLGTKVTIEKRRHGGRIVIHYFSQPELDRIVETLLG